MKILKKIQNLISTKEKNKLITEDIETTSQTVSLLFFPDLPEKYPVASAENYHFLFAVDGETINKEQKMYLQLYQVSDNLISLNLKEYIDIITDIRIQNEDSILYRLATYFGVVEEDTIEGIYEFIRLRGYVNTLDMVEEDDILYFNIPDIEDISKNYMVGREDIDWILDPSMVYLQIRLMDIRLNDLLILSTLAKNCIYKQITTSSSGDTQEPSYICELAISYRSILTKKDTIGKTILKNIYKNIENIDYFEKYLDSKIRTEIYNAKLANGSEVEEVLEDLD
jgi:hypothetical protein